jgi:hypothetical protein
VSKQSKQWVRCHIQDTTSLGNYCNCTGTAAELSQGKGQQLVLLSDAPLTYSKENILPIKGCDRCLQMIKAPH